MLVDLSFNPYETAEKIVKFIKQTVYKAGFSRVIIGLSGGVDSATSCALAVKALGPENVFVGFFPYQGLSTGDWKDGEMVVKKLAIPLENIVQIEIKPILDSFVSALFSGNGDFFKKNHDSGKQLNDLEKVRKGNIMARIRMILLYDLAKKLNALVLGTENKTEYLLGYFTRFGDEASDLEPIRHLYKTQVIKLAKYLGLPEKIIKKKPTAGLWPGQTDEEELGFSYEVADKVLYLYLEVRKSKKEIIKAGFGEEIVEKVIKRIETNQFKHKTPYFLKK